MAGYAASFVWGAHGIMLGTVTYGMMTAFLQLVAQVQGPMLTLSELLPKLVQSTTDRLRALGDKAEIVSAIQMLAEKSTPSIPQDITLQNVSFCYSDGKRDVLHNLTLTFPACSATAIVGPTGSGKSTLVRLVLGLLEPNEGYICTGGQRIAIARALLQPGTVMILDEASSALYPQTERQILEEIQKIQTGKTLIWVTHHEVVKEYMQRVIDIR